MEGKTSAMQFNADQLEAIMRGKERIPDFTWHHHQESGRMQLISRDIHETVKHVGGFEMWGGK